MERNQPIRPSSKAEVIPILSDGIITVQPNKALRIFSEVFKSADKPVLCVEGETDQIILETAWKCLNGDSPMPFLIQDLMDCYTLLNLFKRGDVFWL